VLPFRLEASLPEPDARLAPGTEPPPYVTGYRRPGRGTG
jgi:hypothetical protein